MPGPPERGASCPSSSCEPGHLLIGIVRADGTVVGVEPPMAVDDDFVERATEPGRRPPETRFRFAGPCVESACRHWAADRCGLGDAAANAANRLGRDGRIPSCAIRSTCRWWSQSGPSACRVCREIVRNPEEQTS